MIPILIGFALVVLIDLPTLMRARAWRDVAAFFVLFLPALVISVMLERGMEVPSAMREVGKLLRSLGLSY